MNKLPLSAGWVRTRHARPVRKLFSAARLPVFQRDAGGRITGFIYLRGSHSQTFKRKAA